VSDESSPPPLRFDFDREASAPPRAPARSARAQGGSTLPVREPPRPPDAARLARHAPVYTRYRMPSRQGPWAGLPLRLRWAISLLVAVVLVVLLVRYVNSNTADQPTFSSPKAQVTANREAAVLVRQDQTPHTATLRAGADPASALASAVTADMNTLIARNVIYGPVQHTACQPAGSVAGRGEAFHCVSLANNVNYPFLGVVDVATGRITFCKSDPPPVPSMRIPVSPRCR
jgi:hypothetical protein